jgi:uncharacterized membrane protein
MLHPLIVHLPIGLLATVPPLLTLARLVPAPAERLFAAAGSINLLIGTLGALAAVASGLAAWPASPAPAALDNLRQHLTWAIGATCGFSALTVLRIAGASLGARPGWPMAGASWLLLAALAAAGYYGGENVYRYGLGVLSP